MTRAAKVFALVLLLGAAAALAYGSHRALSPGSQRSAAWAESYALARRADSSKALVPALALRAEAVQRLRELSGAGKPADRSHAALLAGLLQLESSGQDRGNRRAHLEDAVAAFQRAVRIDPENDDAAYDLELLLTRSKSDGRPLGKPRPKRRAIANGQAGTSPPGSGY
jgi:hypothetical protein